MVERRLLTSAMSTTSGPTDPPIRCSMSAPFLAGVCHGRTEVEARIPRADVLWRAGIFAGDAADPCAPSRKHYEVLDLVLPLVAEVAAAQCHKSAQWGGEHTAVSVKHRRK